MKKLIIVLSVNIIAQAALGYTDQAMIIACVEDLSEKLKQCNEIISRQSPDPLASKNEIKKYNEKEENCNSLKANLVKAKLQLVSQPNGFEDGYLLKKFGPGNSLAVYLIGKRGLQVFSWPNIPDVPEGATPIGVKIPGFMYDDAQSKDINVNVRTLKKEGFGKVLDLLWDIKSSGSGSYILPKSLGPNSTDEFFKNISKFCEIKNSTALEKKVNMPAKSQ